MDAGRSSDPLLSSGGAGCRLSRNNALLRADADLCLFSDEDIVYDDGAAERIIEGFEQHPEADMLLFNVRVQAEPLYPTGIRFISG